eukprot:6212327-Pyramimonas_sp.AAC.1
MEESLSHMLIYLTYLVQIIGQSLAFYFTAHVIFMYLHSVLSTYTMFRDPSSITHNQFNNKLLQLSQNALLYQVGYRTAFPASFVGIGVLPVVRSVPVWHYCPTLLAVNHAYRVSPRWAPLMYPVEAYLSVLLGSFDTFV